MALTRKDIFNFNFFNYGEYFTGSYRGIRYRLGREPLKKATGPDAAKEAMMRCQVWPEPYSFEHTDESLISVRDFEYSEEGLCHAIDWINEVHDRGPEGKSS